MYQFEGKMRIQSEGGPIGLRLTGVVARLVMKFWEKKFLELVKENLITIYLLAWYVDDVNLLVKALEMGWRWTGQKLEWKEEWRNEDLESNMMSDVRTMKELRKMSDSILDFVQFEEVSASQCPGGKVPMLDFQLWKEEQKVKVEGKGEILKTSIKFEFYEKKVACNTVIMESSAMPKRTKISTLSQEIIRRMKNTSRNISNERRNEILSEFMKKMKRSGYNAKTRREVLISGMKGYIKMVRTEEEGGTKVNRPRWEGATTRRYRKLAGKSNWYKKKSNSSKEVTRCASKKARKRRKGEEEEKKVEAVMFVPHTPGGLLAKMLQEADDKVTKVTGEKRIKIVEKEELLEGGLLFLPEPRWESK